MKTQLPTTRKTKGPACRQAGFTLVELLIVVSILAILAVIGITVFGNTQKSARDSRRRADIESIAKAMEVNYSDSSAQYTTLVNTMLSGGVVPTDPSSGSSVCGTGNTVVCKYCVRSGVAECASGDTTVAGGTAPGATANGTSWTVCANLETGTTRSFCRSNQR